MKDPFREAALKGAYMRGRKAFEDGLDTSACPYGKKEKPNGRHDWVADFVHSWTGGWYSARDEKRALDAWKYVDTKGSYTGEFQAGPLHNSINLAMPMRVGKFLVPRSGLHVLKSCMSEFLGYVDIDANTFPGHFKITATHPDFDVVGMIQEIPWYRVTYAKEGGPIGFERIERKKLPAKSEPGYSRSEK